MRPGTTVAIIILLVLILLASTLQLVFHLSF
jgi:hypothetical protein